MQNDMSIGEVASKFGLAASAIRFYEQEGLLPPARRRSGRRVYDSDILHRLSVIELAKAAGFTIREIRELLDGCTGRARPGSMWRQLAQRKRSELQRSIETAQRMQAILDQLLACECPTLVACGKEASAASTERDRESSSRR